LVNKEPVSFKTEDSLWQVMRKGMKTWDARWVDLKDERFQRLFSGHYDKPSEQGRRPFYAYDEAFICYENKLTGQILQFTYRGFIMQGWAPGWVFLQLGGVVATYDKDGSEIIEGG
jgi:hypothetical protein